MSSKFIRNPFDVELVIFNHKLIKFLVVILWEILRQLLVNEFTEYIKPSPGKPPLNLAIIGLTREVALQQVILYSKYNIFLEKSGLSKEVIF